MLKRLQLGRDGHVMLLLVKTGDGFLKGGGGARTEGQAASHLCDLSSCQLPAADW